MIQLRSIYSISKSVMQMRKIIATGALATLLVGCEFLGGTPAGENGDTGDTTAQVVEMSKEDALKAVSSAVQKTFDELETATTEAKIEADINLNEPSGSINVAIDASGKGGKTSGEAKYKLTFGLSGDIKDLSAAQAGPESGSAEAEFRLVDEVAYMKLNSLELKPEQVMATLNMLMPTDEIMGKWYSMDMSELLAVTNPGLDGENIDEMTTREMMVESMMASTAEQGTPISKEAAEKIVDLMLDASNYLKVTKSESVSAGVKHYIEIDYDALGNLVDKFAKIVEEETGEKRPEEFESEVKKGLEMVKEAFQMKGSVTINNDGFIAGFDIEMTITPPEGESPELKNIEISFSETLTDINKEFTTTAPENAEEIDTSAFMSPMMMGGGMGGNPAQIGDDFYPCDSYGPCTEETDTKVVDADGDVWLYNEATEKWEIEEVSAGDFYPCDSYGPCTEETDTRVVDAEGDVWVYSEDLSMWIMDVE